MIINPEHARLTLAQKQQCFILTSSNRDKLRAREPWKIIADWVKSIPRSPLVSEVQPEYPDPEEEEREDEGEEDEVEEEEEEEDKQDYDDDEGSVGSDEDEECENPWKKLKLEVVGALDPLLQKQAEPYLEKGASQDIAAAKAMNDLLPTYRKKLRSLYLHYLKWYRCLKQDPIHRQVMKTLRKFMDEDDMDYEEASEAAVNKRNFY